MLNFKWGLIFALFALITSIALGILFGVNPVHIIIRAIIFTVVFFGLGMGINYVINTFFPEILLYDDSHSQSDTQNMNEQGSLLNITLGGSGEYAVPELYKDSDGGEEMGNIEDLISGNFKVRPSSSEREHSTESFTGGIDRNGNGSYNNMAAAEDNADAENDDMFSFQGMQSAAERLPVKPVFTPSFGDDSGLGGLPDLDAMAGAFSPGYSADSALQAHSASFVPASPVQAFSSEEAPRAVQYNKGNKTRQLEGDFDPKELAEGIRTILSKDK